MKIYETKIWNEHPGTLNLALDFYGQRRANIPGNGKLTVQGVWWENFSPFKEAVYKESGKVKLVKRIGFKRNFEKTDWILKISNYHPQITNYKIGALFSPSFTIPQGLEIFCPVDPRDPLAEWKSIVIYPDIERERIAYGMAPVSVSGQMAEMEKDSRTIQRTPNLIYKKRGEKELEKLKELRLKLKIEDPEAFKYFDNYKLWNQNRWQVTPDMLREPGEKTTEQRLQEEGERMRKEAEEYENYR